MFMLIDILDKIILRIYILAMICFEMDNKVRKSCYVGGFFAPISCPFLNKSYYYIYSIFLLKNLLKPHLKLEF